MLRQVQQHMNYVSVLMYVEDGCHISQGEYSLHITSIIGALDINANGGGNDVSLILEAVEECIQSLNVGDVTSVEFRLKESGEWEDVFWHKYYEVDSFAIIQ